MDADTADRADLGALLAFDAGYIRSVQGGDARRFGEILAADFLCSNPDGSLVDKAGFLAQTARPVTIRGPAAEDVKARVLGDVAIVHARTSCTAAKANGGTAATPTFGRAGAGAGSRCRRT